jgi:hypothetical protein
MRKPTICVDFDGVLNEYSGYDADDLGSPRKGSKEFLEKLHKRYFVVILSARRYSKIIRWLDQYDLWEYVDDVTSIKPPAKAYIDDRGLQFKGDYDRTLKDLKRFKPYWKE